VTLIRTEMPIPRTSMILIRLAIHERLPRQVMLWPPINYSLCRGNFVYRYFFSRSEISVATGALMVISMTS
jgi:hypothetical protein